MTAPFPSTEWTQKLCRTINESVDYAKAARKWEGDLLLIIENEGAVYLDLWHGKCKRAEYYEDTTPVEAEFSIAANREKWVSVLNGELDPIQGLMKRQLQLKGNLVKIMKHIKAAQELVKCASSVSTQGIRQ